MAQSTSLTMGPPISPRETRRSGRRSANSHGHSHSNSTGTSKGPDSPPPPAQTHAKDGPASAKTQAGSSNAAGGRNSRRFKQEDLEDGVGEMRGRAATAASSSASSTTTTRGTGRAKRKGKHKNDEKTPTVELVIDTHSVTKSNGGPSRDISISVQEEEEQGITRCVCGSAEDDPDAGEFMVQCETCKVWQHGLCMGYEAEDQLPDDDYHCEQCRPDLHKELIKKQSKRARQSSTTSILNTASTSASVLRPSRSVSPLNSFKPAKRRNTMNSRDANFEIIFRETLAATAAEAEAAAHEDGGESILDPEDEAEAGRKKRKRTEDDAETQGGTRSMSTESDRVIHSAISKDEPPESSRSNSNTRTKAPSARNRRGGGRKSAMAAAVMIQEVGAALNADDDGPPAKRSSHSSRPKSSNVPRRPPASHTNSQNLLQPDSRRHNASNATSSATGGSGSGGGGGAGGGGGGVSSAAGSGQTVSAAAYRTTHAYAVSQQPLYTSWGLPDYLSHLTQVLPSDVPRPLEVRGSGIAGNDEAGTERGVKVKWPGKRMSVGDMNKRVRALVEWVGREQAVASERSRRKETLEKRVKDVRGGESAPDEIDGMETDPGAAETANSANSAMKTMEELMEELIGFQEKFGPALKVRERERRMAMSC